ncbi:4-diphosphocytidyl-2C-methyl-D-erythritol kinase [Amycolatopsis sp. MJM2582]|uniref:4-diphosphocytidyl-2-C-methyl-D-erythritol kinase n=5 Tax=Amycolatopsis TaxID=1813 RepID=M2XS13_9PSEU|nr:MULTISPECIES: 4-(cytidine 5'-diphospho)-2-C-methyl-D-erythritol kinase [Amycolatopsis]RSN09060.1 4-(cytidine 5'-diphospho)-2-C-methyl-D-erythritol kinase [Streptomyces sp. WAC 05977]AIG73716.1 4-diphosphocytidyl-2-C-methyl-D-erythritolkinase [Amycolatopsis japonica]EME63781.1 4-diphosphocytidyl-2-C-methyl-D-erythritol kinase [Amycolatopsis decaplanina DSM 44594]KFZ79600.1 4-diphosphocytidyl-2C-methyl-D-erythritol kinase [Amycolatopsis sp. MJM2582]MBE1576213.1 4-diphosphocytidyl-2-C-methyl-D
MLAVVPPPVTVRVPAKVNLHLSVGDVRPDGYHELVTVFQALSLTDEVTVAVTEDPGVEVYGEGEGSVPTGANNLAWKAAQALAAHVGKADGESKVRVVLRKGIPVAGGMAGGSADAAATLVGLASLWKLDISRDELAGIAAKLGSDVPFALYGGTALGTGRGEQLVPVLSRHTFHWVLAFDQRGLSTPRVFGELDKLREEGSPPRIGSHTPVVEALASGDPRQLALLLGNDLQAAAVSLRPGLRRTLRAGVNAGALAGTVSGSGPTCAFLCADAQSAVEVAAELSGAGVCRTVRVAHGPVPGARLVGGDDAPRPSPPRVHA